jgi:ribosome biogenesis GTPase
MIENYGYIQDYLPSSAKGVAPANAGGFSPARVTAVHKERYELICEHGECYGRLKSSIYYTISSEEFPTTGDFVLIEHNPIGDSVIIATLPRKSHFSRRAPGKIPKDQTIAANFDYVFIMQSLNQDFNVKRLERYLTLAWQSGALPVVVLTKADLCEDFTEQVRTAGKAAAGVGVFAVSAHTGYGLEMLDDYLKPRKTIVFLGSSGVGKSSLLNALAKREGETDDIMEVKAIREDDARGRHTTTHRQLVMLKSGVMIIDTPGMRELGMWDVSDGLGGAFADVEQYLGKCKFTDCEHESEPGCAINGALERGELSRERWGNYLKLKREARFVEEKERVLQIKNKRNKEIAMFARTIKNKRS